jgi:hypothetical protein
MNPACPSGKDIKNITQRELSHIPVQDVINSFAGKRVRTVTRVIFEKKDEWKFYSNNTLAHYVTSKILQLDDELVKAFHMIPRNNTSWVADNDQKDWYSGYCVFDIEWKEPIFAKDITKYAAVVNKDLHVGAIKAIYDIDKTQELSTKYNASYISLLKGISLGKITERFNNFDWQVKIVSKGAQGPEVTKKYMPELKDKILFVPHGSEVYCFMNLPITVSPYYVLSSILGIPEPAARTQTFKCVDVGIASDIVCKNDGIDANFSCIVNKQLAECPVCRGKKQLYLMTRK